VVTVTLAPGAADAQEVFDEGNGWFATRDLRANATMQPGASLRIESVSTLEGSISIVTSPNPGIDVVYRKKARTNQLSRAIDYIDLIAFSIDNSARGVTMQFRAPNPPPWNEKVEAGRVEVEITMPESCIVMIDAAYFDVEAEGPFSEVRVPSSYGRLQVADVDGSLELQTANRRLIVERIRGEMDLRTSNSTLDASDLYCPEIQARIQNEGGDIRIERLEGQANIKNSYGRIEVADYRPVGTRNFIRGLSGPVFLEIRDLDGARLIVNNRYEDIELSVPQDVSSSMSLAVEEDGRIEVSNFVFTSDLVEHNRLNLIAGEGTATISASVRGNGNIYVRGDQRGEQ
jgi:hypothetical protein